ncbi:MAG: c-type cytochrome biogenesis protein CcmI [Idiomarina sp.]|nr:c-type cytochrome biogenesis protein CcmI [Idiomarina sp.]
MWYVILVVLMLVAVALLFVARRQQLSTWSTLQANKEVYESRLEEIEEDLAQGLLSQKDLANAQRELQKSFVTDVHDPDEKVEMKPANVWWIAVVLVVAAGGIYIADGSWQQQRQADQARAELEERSRRLLSNSGEAAETQEIVMFALGLRQRLQEQPDAGAWSLYGRLMMQLRQTDQAIEAFERSRQLNSTNVGNLLAYSQALIMSGSDPDLARAARFIRQILESDRTNSEALGLLGVVAYERGDFNQAVQAWELTLQIMDEQDPRYAVIQGSLEDARGRADGSVLTLTVTVDISETMRNELPFNATLFVFVRDPDGERAPIAVTRQRITDFPITVTLTDDDAMTPDRTLSSVRNWLVGARVTASGTIELRQGDMEARPRLIERENRQQIELRITEMIL